jgi:hypothetical protein
VKVTLLRSPYGPLPTLRTIVHVALQMEKKVELGLWQMPEDVRVGEGGMLRLVHDCLSFDRVLE